MKKALFIHMHVPEPENDDLDAYFPADFLKYHGDVYMQIYQLYI